MGVRIAPKMGGSKNEKPMKTSGRPLHEKNRYCNRYNSESCFYFDVSTVNVMILLPDVFTPCSYIEDFTSVTHYCHYFLFRIEP